MDTGDKIKAQALAKKGNTPEEIGKIVGVHRTTIWRYLKEISPKNQALTEFKSKKADVLAYIQGLTTERRLWLLESMTELEFAALDVRQRAALNRDLAVAQGIDFDKEQLERGKPTQIQGFTDMQKSLSDTQREIDALESEIIDMVPGEGADQDRFRQDTDDSGLDKE